MGGSSAARRAERSALRKGQAFKLRSRCSAGISVLQGLQRRPHVIVELPEPMIFRLDRRVMFCIPSRRLVHGVGGTSLIGRLMDAHR